MDFIPLETVIDQCKPLEEIEDYTPPNDVVFDIKGTTSQRNIFKRQVFTNKEISKIINFREEILKSEIKIPEDWDDSELLKFLYGSNFNVQKAVKDLRCCLEYREEMKIDTYKLQYSNLYKILVTYN
jgi:hypothetical protein